MTEFTKMKISFALALLGTLFALHPFLDPYDDAGFNYLGVKLKIFHAYALTAALISACVYLYAMTLMNDHSHSWLERAGNATYSLAILVPPIFVALYFSAKLAERVAVSHVAWAAPTVAIGLGAGWLALSQVIAWRIRTRLGDRDRHSKIRELARREVESLNQARDLLAGEHFDLCVIEAWHAFEARLRRALLERRIMKRLDTADSVLRVAARKGLLREPISGVVDELRRNWVIALGTEPSTREAAISAISAVRHILSVLPAAPPARVKDSHDARRGSSLAAEG